MTTALSTGGPGAGFEQDKITVLCKMNNDLQFVINPETDACVLKINIGNV